MRVLALDTALDSCSAAFLAEGRVVAGRSEARPRGHGERIAAMCVEVLREAEVRPADLDRVCVTIGPGSFTGVRIGLATARGYGVALGIPVVGITTLVAVAAPYWSAGAVLAAHDARRGQVYAQAFGPAGVPLGAAKALAPGDAARLWRTEMTRIVGSGASLVAAHLDRLDGTTLLDERPDAAVFGGLAERLAAPEAPPEPLYLRTPDAVPRVERA